MPRPSRAKRRSYATRAPRSKRRLNVADASGYPRANRFGCPVPHGKQVAWNPSSVVIQEGINASIEEHDAWAPDQVNPKHIGTTLMKLRGWYRLAIRDGQQLESFDLWVSSKLRQGMIPVSLKTGLERYLVQLGHYYSNAEEEFGEDCWRFLLFFDNLVQRTVKALRAVKAAKQWITLPELYKKADEIRSHRTRDFSVVYENDVIDFECLKFIPSDLFKAIKHNEIVVRPVENTSGSIESTSELANESHHLHNETVAPFRSSFSPDDIRDVMENGRNEADIFSNDEFDDLVPNGFGNESDDGLGATDGEEGSVEADNAIHGIPNQASDFRGPSERPRSPTQPPNVGSNGTDPNPGPVSVGNQHDRIAGRDSTSLLPHYSDSQFIDWQKECLPSAQEEELSAEKYFLEMSHRVRWLKKCELEGPQLISQKEELQQQHKQTLRRLGELNRELRAALSFQHLPSPHETGATTRSEAPQGMNSCEEIHEERRILEGKLFECDSLLTEVADKLRRLRYMPSHS